MLTYILKAQVKKLKMKLKVNFYIENIKFKTFNTINVQFARKKNSMFNF